MCMQPASAEERHIAAMSAGNDAIAASALRAPSVVDLAIKDVDLLTVRSVIIGGHSSRTQRMRDLRFHKIAFLFLITLM